MKDFFLRSQIMLIFCGHDFAHFLRAFRMYLLKGLFDSDNWSSSCQEHLVVVRSTLLLATATPVFAKCAMLS